MRAKERKNANKRGQGNNKGFSLVELIVVIAIIAVLAALLAPQFTKYIDRSRQSADASTVSAIVTAAQVGVADVTTYDIGSGTYTVTIGENGTSITSAKLPDGNGNAPGITDFTKAIVDSCGALEDLKVTANAWDSVVITINVKSDYSIDVSYASTTDGQASTTFATYINGNKTPTAES